MTSKTPRGGAEGDDGSPRPERRSPGQVFAELHYRLRTEGETPRERAAAVWLGTVIGCLPVYGLHLLLCLVFARLLGVSRILTYLAAHVNNQFTAPVLLLAEYAIGHRIVERRWPALDWDSMRASSVLDVGRDLFVGALVLGLVLGTLLAAVTLVVSSRFRRASFEIRLREAISDRYRTSGVFSWEFVRGKLRHDPLYFGVLRSGVLPDSGRLVDLGCGRGIFLALLATAAALRRDGGWSDEWPAPPARLALVGVEGREEHADIARRAVPEAEVETGDLTRHRLPEGEVILLFDVLHYLGERDQEALVERVASALRPGGMLLVREADRGQGLRFLLTRLQERLATLGRGHWRQRFHYRSTREWEALFERHGLAAASRPMAEGTPFANDLIVARKEARREQLGPLSGPAA